jgi:hypothetical protein
MGVLHRAMGDIDSGRVQFRLAAAVYNALVAQHEVALTRHNLGVLHLDLDRHRLAQVLLSGVVEDFAAPTEPDPYNHAHALVDLGLAHLGLGWCFDARTVRVDTEARLLKLGNSAELARVLQAQADVADATDEPGREHLRRTAVGLKAVGSARAAAL